MADYRSGAHAAKLSEFLRLARLVDRTMDSDLTCKEKHDIIFSEGLSERMRKLVDLEYYDPDSDYEGDVLAFASAVKEKAERVALMLKVLEP